MLFEYAIDPNVITDLESLCFIANKFGVPHGRLISRFPKKPQRGEKIVEVEAACADQPDREKSRIEEILRNKPQRWEKMVEAACKDQPDREKSRIQEILRKMAREKTIIASGRKYYANQTWLENAEQQQYLKKFHAIIANDNPNECEDVLIYNTIRTELEKDIPLFKVQRNQSIPRTPKALATSVSMLLQNSREILFIDPHFGPETSRWRVTLQAFLKAATETGHQLARCEYHLKAKSTSQFFKETGEKELPKIIPKDLQLTLIRWEENQPGEKFHARYILTDIGGVHIDVGLDKGDEGETTLINLLDVESWKKCWDDFQKTANTYKYIDEVTLIGE